MKQKILKVHPKDNVIVALADLQANKELQYQGRTYQPVEFIPAKHKFAVETIAAGGQIIMYGVLVGMAQTYIAAGALLTTANVKHAASGFHEGESDLSWDKPEITKWQHATFKGYHRNNGDVGTANYWLVIPMVFCENRNIEVLQEALLKPLGYG
ncbi:MAG: altronate dehydratase, partial [Sphingobacteriales bacterium]